MQLRPELSAKPAQVSHVYELNWQSPARNAAASCAVVLLAGILAFLLARSSAAPTPALLADPDSAIISAKATLARTSTNAQLALVGDSSCLINLDAATIQSESHLQTVNLGTLSYLSLDSFGLLARRFTEGKPSPRILLVLHPDCLRMIEASQSHRAILETALGQNRTYSLSKNDSLSDWLGFEDLKARFTDRWIPTPLKGNFGVRYGFTVDLQRDLYRRMGTMDETATYDPRAQQGSSEYRLSPRIKTESELFRSMLPAGTRIRVVVSPVPKSHAMKSHEQTIVQIRTQLELWIGAETPPLNLPLVLPDTEFGTVTHLLPEAALRYSKLVAEQVRQW